jgi:hypothetical protein
MCPESEFGAGLKWIEGVMTVRDEKGDERLVARVAAGTGMEGTRDWRLGVFNDTRGVFESVKQWDVRETHDSSHPFLLEAGGVTYLYLYPNFRVRAELSALREWHGPEAYTCVAGDGKARGAGTIIDRDAEGRARYAWKAGADRLHAGRLKELTRAGVLKPEERWLQLRDLETDRAVEAGRGSVFWNEYRRRWVMVMSGQAGELWYSEGDTPVGPWVYARRVASHGRYNFYNPTQHPFFDQAGGRIIYFEGTYTASFSGAPAKTPRYDYNQVMYRLHLDDPRLHIPSPVYRVRRTAEKNGGRNGTTNSSDWQMRDDIVAARAWDKIERVAFFALSSGPARNEAIIPVYRKADDNGWQTNAPSALVRPAFWALPEAGTNNPPGSISLSEFAPAPPCRVWKTPAETLILDPVGQSPR